MENLADQLKPGVFLSTGHRGAASLAPENTMASIRKALDLGVDLVELDVRATADGRIVALHDETVDRTTDGRGDISRMPYEAVLELDAGYRFASPAFPFRGRGVRIPLLEEIFEAFPAARFTVEIKSPTHPGFLETLAAMVLRQAKDRVILASDPMRPLEQIRRRLPGVPTNLSRPEVRQFYCMEKIFLSRLFRSTGIVFQVPVYSGGDNRRGLHVVTRRFVRAAHNTGRPVQVWTVNDPDEMRRLLALDVDGLVTDRPDLLNEVLRESPPRRVDRVVWF
ncbi:MAG: hypothetical protein A3G34_09205 [Candidatus Lindowbacteria bacterium RIFCSPLOWO2_12_FULL_62_27]|nr:MAG: hypothetical protein A3I06_07870 [Candidatus Lindowbacteria bacterium RIFCSPLOWO2_02_FULL_62_12]OGH60217.1 MAG: hypothetical protein A3G34_09205 [Candidatus Lindowbacteria bacterium RIFCSPLOWO2_12_FULL_62_27]